MKRSIGRALLAALLFAGAGVGSGCDATRRTARSVEQGLNPFSASKASILRLDRHGPYLLVEFRQGRSLLTLLAPADDAACAQMLRPEGSVTYRKHGNFGRFEQDGERCDPVGVGSLATWRDRQPRGARGGGPIPRAPARFREIGRDESVVLVRGRFPLANRVGVPNGLDVVALLPVQDPACARPIAAGTASLEFVPAGREALRLIGERASCPVLALALPLATANDPD
jgi:hypothetical protein